MSKPTGLLAKERKALVSKIGEYRKRREPLKYNRREKERIRILDNGIMRYSRKLKKIDENVSRIKPLINTIEEFIGTSPKGASRTPLRSTARALYYKWGIENGIPSPYLRKYIDGGSPEAPSQTRRRFTRSFTSKPENKELWHRFKQFIEEPSNQIG